MATSRLRNLRSFYVFAGLVKQLTSQMRVAVVSLFVISTLKMMMRVLPVLKRHVQLSAKRTSESCGGSTDGNGFMAVPWNTSHRENIGGSTRSTIKIDLGALLVARGFLISE